MDRYKVKQLGVSDVDQIERIFTSVAEEIYATSKGDSFLDYENINEYYINDPRAFVIGVHDQEHNEIVGTTAIKPFEDDSNILEVGSLEDGISVAELTRHFILPNHRKKGLGPSMLDWVEKFSIELGYTHIYLETSESKPELLSYYYKKGYKIVSIDEFGNAHLLKVLAHILDYTDDFNIPPGLVYLDSASTTQKPKVVVKEVQQHISELSVNPGRGSYGPSEECKDRIERVRSKVGEFISAMPNEIVFTSGATASIEMLAHSWGINNLKSGDEILLCEEDHKSTVMPWFQIQELLKQRGLDVKINYYHRDNAGKVDMESIRNSSSGNIKLIVITYSHNVYGTISNIKEIKKIVGSRCNILLDACQSISYMPINVKELGVDFLVFSGHKMFAMEGIGVLYVDPKHNDSITLYRHLGESNDDIQLSDILEVGTQNVTGIISLGAGIDFINNLGFDQIQNQISRLKVYLYQQLSGLDNIELISSNEQSSLRSGIVSFRVNGISSSEVGEVLNLNRIYVRTGSHCINSENKIRDSIRVSLHVYNTKENIDMLINVLKTSLV